MQDLGRQGHQCSARIEHQPLDHGGVGLGLTDDHFDLLEHPDIQELLKPGGGSIIEVPVDPAPDSAATRLACLALRQAGLWGEPHFAVEVAHPRFAEAVEAAAAACDEQKALEAALAILNGPEAAESF